MTRAGSLIDASVTTTTRQSGLPSAARATQRQQPHICAPEQYPYEHTLLFASNKRGWLCRQAAEACVKRLEWWKDSEHARGDELKNMLWLSEILQAVHAQIPQLHIG